MSDMTGGCLCGAVRFSASGVNTSYHVCHCSMCRRWSGSPLMATSVDGIEFEDEGTVVRYASSDWAERGFCVRCGSSIFYYLKPADRYVVSVGAFDDPQALRLIGEIFVDHQPPGYRFAGKLSRMTEAEFLARFAPE
jgi:hypothetical protein